MNTSNLNNAFAGAKKSKFDKDDFMIKDFGFGDDGNPFLIVVGNPGDQLCRMKILDTPMYLKLIRGHMR
jgi:hypothetical protein